MEIGVHLFASFVYILDYTYSWLMFHGNGLLFRMGWATEAQVRDRRPIKKESTNSTRKTKNRILAIPAAAAARVKNPKMPASSVKTRNMTVHPSMRFTPFRGSVDRAIQNAVAERIELDVHHPVVRSNVFLGQDVLPVARLYRVGQDGLLLGVVHPYGKMHRPVDPLVNDPRIVRFRLQKCAFALINLLQDSSNKPYNEEYYPRKKGSFFALPHKWTTSQSNTVLK